MKITFSSPTADLTGYSQLSRTLIGSLHQIGADIAVNPFSLEADRADNGAFGKLCSELARKKQVPDINIITMIPLLFNKFRKPNCLNIGYTMFEMTKLPADWVKYCNEMDGILVPAYWNKDIFRSSGVTVPIETAPPGIEVPEYVTPPKSGPFTFLSVFQWIPRKDPEGLLRAYWSQFSGHDDVKLVIKTYRKNRSKEEFTEISNAVARLKSSMKLDHFPAVEFITGVLSNQEMLDLYRNSHAFVLPSKGEGFGLPYMTAMAHGRPVIGTGFSGQTEFMDEKNSYPVKYNLSPVHGMQWFHNFCDSKMLWADCHLDDLMAKMDSVYRNREKAEKIGWCGRQTMVQEFSLDQTAKDLLAILERWNKELRK